MLIRILAISALLLATNISERVGAEEPGDPSKGAAYAQKVCAHCHAVRKGDNFSPNALAPSFETIANTPGMTGISLAATLHSSHENMPNFVLSANERDNIIAYILSLKKQQ
jgi:mono/diheme cytochrome c family protein